MSVSFETSPRGRTQLFSQEAAQRILSQLLAHHEVTKPREAVGVVLRDSSVIRFRNWSRKTHAFKASNFKLLWLLGWGAWRHGTGIAYIYHSHTQSSSPSQTDQAFMYQLAQRWPSVGHLIFTPHGEFSIYYGEA